MEKVSLGRLAMSHSRTCARDQQCGMRMGDKDGWEDEQAKTRDSRWELAAKDTQPGIFDADHSGADAELEDSKLLFRPLQL
eukprot:scaffold147344_cov21-Tisochrysis_lutea.AAC.1